MYTTATRAALILGLWTGHAFQSGFARADEVVPRQGVVHFEGRLIETRLLENAMVTAPAFDPGRRYLICLDGPMTPERRAALDAAGVRLLDYLPYWSYAADLSASTPPRVAALGFVTWVGHYQPAWKLAPGLGTTPALSPARRALEAEGRLPVQIWLFEGDDPEPAIAAIAGTPGVTIGHVDRAGSAASVFAAVTPAALADLAAIERVRYIHDQPHFAPRDVNATWVVQSNVQNSHPAWERGLTGQGQIVGIIDGWVAWQHCAFLDPGVMPGPNHRKILAYNSAFNYDAHGTYVAALAVGDPLPPNPIATRGMAYGARMVFNTWPEINETSVFERFLLHHTQGARVHNNSWGNDFSTAYDGPARAIDNFTWQFDDNLLVFAVSNYQTIRNPENSKNPLAVTATGNFPNQAGMCSAAGVPGPGRGPTSDGRRKPDVAAPGCPVLSATGATGCATWSTSGTSASAPLVAGAAALLRQFLMEGWHPAGARIGGNAFTPGGALLKAMLANAAQDLPQEPGYPNDREGWGRVLLDDAMTFAGDVRRSALFQAFNNTPQALHTGQFSQWTVEVTNTSVPLRAALAFFDAPAAAGTAFAPVNDLNLVVVSPTGTTYRGNRFAGGVSVSGGTPDAINSLELVLLPEPQAGTWTVRVEAAAVNVGRQGYGVAVTYGGPPACPADYDGNGVVDFNDMLQFLNYFHAQNPMAELTGDGVVDFNDMLEFLNRYNAGC